MGKTAQQATKKPGEFFQDFSRQRRRASGTAAIKRADQGRSARIVIGTEEPEWLLVLEQRREVTFEIVLKDEDVQEIGIASRAERVPR